MKGTLSPNQSRYLGGVFSTPLFQIEGNGELKQYILQAYLDCEDSSNTPESLPNEIKLLVEYGLATGEKYVELSDDGLSLAEVVRQTKSPFLEETEEVEGWPNEK